MMSATLNRILFQTHKWPYVNYYIDLTIILISVLLKTLCYSK